MIQLLYISLQWGLLHGVAKYYYQDHMTEPEKNYIFSFKSCSCQTYIVAAV